MSPSGVGKLVQRGRTDPLRPPPSLARKLRLIQHAVSISVKRGQVIADENVFQLLDK